MLELIRIMKDGREYAFCGTSISICPDSQELISIKNAACYVDGTQMVELGENFLGHRYSAEEAAISVIRAYINGNKTFRTKYVIPYISNYADDFFEESGMREQYISDRGTLLLRQIPLRYFGERALLPLQMVDKDGMQYYSNDDEFILVRPDGSLASDYEFLYENSMIESLENKDYKYKSEE